LYMIDNKVKLSGLGMDHSCGYHIECSNTSLNKCKKNIHE
jgi:hypothetical protein